MRTTQSTNTTPEHEAPTEDVYGTKVDHEDDLRYMTFTDPICGQEHRLKVSWDLGTRFAYTYRQCPTTGETLGDTVFNALPPHGYAAHFRQGYANPWTTYPDNAPSMPSFDIVDALEDGNPTGDESCPPGCIRDHTDNPDDIYHDGPVWSHKGRPDDGMPSKFYFRTQQHLNADPRESYGWVNLEVFDQEFGEWHEMAFNMTEVQQLADILQSHLTGKRRLKTPETRGDETND